MINLSSRTVKLRKKPRLIWRSPYGYHTAVDIASIWYGTPPPILKVDLSAVIADSFWCINTADNSNRYVSHSIGIIEKVNLNQITHTLIT